MVLSRVTVDIFYDVYRLFICFDIYMTYCSICRYAHLYTHVVLHLFRFKMINPEVSHKTTAICVYLNNSGFIVFLGGGF